MVGICRTVDGDAHKRNLTTIWTHLRVFQPTQAIEIFDGEPRGII
jgi:hypothetical protein